MARGNKPIVLAALSLIVFAALSCNDSSGGSDEEAGFVHTPESLGTFTTGITSNTLNRDGTDHNCSSGQCYCVLVQGLVSETEYLAIAVSDDPTVSTVFNLKIYFPSSTVAGTYVVNENSNITIKVTESGVIYKFGNGSGSVVGGGDVTITVTLQEDTDTYKTYRITFDKAITLDNGGGDLTVTEIIAISMTET
jgi:hypothetical protein